MIATLLITLSLTAAQLINQEQFSKSIEHGRSQFETMQEQAKKNDCWRQAVQYLSQTCSTISRSVPRQQRLAIAFANCHWLSAGRRSYECTEDMSISQCTIEMTDSAFDVYTQFYNHIEDACFYLQSGLWQENTEKLIGSLSVTSEHAVEKITESLERQTILEKGQERSLNNQFKLIRGNEQLQEQLQSARAEVSSMLNDIDQQARSLREEFNEMFLSLSTAFNQIHLMLNWLLLVFVNFECIVLFVTGIVTSYLLTCSKYTARARPIMMGIIVVYCVLVERLLVYLWWFLMDNRNMESLHFVLFINFTRCAMTLMCLYVLVRCNFSYCDCETNKILEEIRKFNLNLKTAEEKQPVTRRYNFRKRRSTYNKILEHETPQQFTNLVLRRLSYKT